MLVFKKLTKYFIVLEVPVYYCNLKSEIKKLKKENWKLKQENTDLTRKLAKFDEIQSK